jgi:hypothetical protein
MFGICCLQSPQTVQAQAVLPSDREMLFEIIASLQAQILSLQNQLILLQTQPVGKTSTDFDDEAKIVVKYVLTQPNDAARITNLTHRQYVQRIFEIAPDELDQMISEFVIFDGEDVAFDAYVQTIGPRHETWQYAVHVDMLTQVDTAANTELIIHELAHLISYEEIIGKPSPAQFACGAYFAETGCPDKNSYLFAFSDLYWSDEDLDRALALVGKYDEEAVYETYAQNRQSFVTDYAASSPEEDFSESFVHFVLGIPIQGAVVTEKISFFNSYQELRDIKKEILLFL